MQEQISKIREVAVDEINKATDSKVLDEVRVKYLGKKR